LWLSFCFVYCGKFKKYQGVQSLIPTAFGSLVGVLAVLANPEEKED